MPNSLYKSLLIMGTAFTLSACGGSSSSSSPEASPQASETEVKTLDSLVRTFSIQTEECPNGGIEIEMGIDSNGNARLDPDEIDHSRTQTVCHGTDGINGTDGTSGSASLIAITAPSIEECPQGGKKILIGIDNNANQILESVEVKQTELLCNAVINASDSITSLVNTTAETAGDNCAAGGIKIESGLDLNNDQILSLDEVRATEYVCSGVNGTNGVDGTGGEINLDDLLIDTVVEPFGLNCLHGGSQHRIGLDENTDGLLQDDEVISTSYSCNANGAPDIEFISYQGNQAISGFDYVLNVQSYDYNNSIYGEDDVELAIISKPDWLIITESTSNSIKLQGIVTGNIGDTFTITVSSTDSDLTTEKSYAVTLVDGIQVSISALPVVEGDLIEAGEFSETPAEFVVSLSKTLDTVMQIQYYIQDQSTTYGKDWKANNRSGVITFEVGETEKKLPLTILGDNQYELEETVQLYLEGTDYSGDDLVLFQQHQKLNIQNDDNIASVALRAGQENTVLVIDTAVDSVTLKNHPEWMSYSNQYQNSCDESGCYGAQQLFITGNPFVSSIGDTASFDIEVQLAGRTITETFTYVVTEGDTDNDGVLNRADAFPENPRGQTDTDTDGLGDEWEMANFDSLVLADGSSDFDGNGITDLSAFENDTPINDISFSFESGELPVGWVNTGNVDWIVTNSSSYQGDYALATANALAPGEFAQIEFEFSSQAGQLSFYRRLAESAQGNNYLLFGDSYIDLYSTSWRSSNKSYSAGLHKVAITYRNDSATHNAPIVYIDNISGLEGMIPADRDGDGVLNAVDLYPDRSDGATDTDEDGIADEWEQRYFGTLDRVNATSDFDNDGLLDINEFIQVTNPTSTNSDNDSVNDGEDAFPTDSNYQADTDNDGLADKWELAHFASLETSDGTQDSDGDSVNDLAEFIAGTPATPDRDGDGAADVVDAFPDNADYKLDNDEDGMADEWENSFGHVSYFSADGDRDNDGRTDLQEFLEGTNPKKANLNAVEDILAVVQGQTITFNPAENDIASQGNIAGITTTSVSLPTGEQANFGSLQNNDDGTFSYTAANDRLGWLRLNYVANDGESDASGEIFIHIVDSAPAQVVKIAGRSNDYNWNPQYSMGLFDDGSLYAWGANDQGQLGLGTRVNTYVPTKISGLPKIVDFALGGKSIALADDGSIWYWGDGILIPTKSVNEAKAIAASRNSTYLLSTSGNVAGKSNIKDISAGINHLLALAEDGTVWAKGSNDKGQLGYGKNTSSSSSFVQVSKLTNIVAIEAGGNQSYAIDADGQLFSWGNNNNGQLGDGTSINRNVPVLCVLSNVVEVTAGYSHTLVRTDENNVYELRSNPSQLVDFKAVSIGAGGNSSFLIDESGLSYGIGNNSYGQLGDGTTQSHAEPAEISWLLDGAVSELGKEGFEWGRIPPYWRNSGNNWQVVSNAAASDVRTGSYAVKVRDRLTDSASASLGLQIATGAGAVTFNVKTSTETEYDKLVFYVDGIEQATFSGINDWVSSAGINVTAGVHSFEWIYHKDGGTSVGEDSIWLDDILLPIDSDGDGVIDREDASPYVSNIPAL